MGPGAVIEPYDPYHNTSRRAVGETRRRLPVALDLEGGPDEGKGRRRVFHSKATWSRILVLVLMNTVIFLAARYISSHRATTKGQPTDGSATNNHVGAHSNTSPGFSTQGFLGLLGFEQVCEGSGSFRLS
eukprot:677365-Prorocentrum_minimum.AAC.4